MSASRWVAFVVTPLLTLAAGAAASLGAKYGLHVDPTQVTTYGVAAATAVAGLGVKWLHGSSLYERAVLEAQHGLAIADKYAPSVAEDVKKAAETEAPKVIEKLEEEIGAPADAFPPAAEPAPATPETPAAA